MAVANGEKFLRSLLEGNLGHMVKPGRVEVLEECIVKGRIGDSLRSQPRENRSVRCGTDHGVRKTRDYKKTTEQENRMHVVR